MGVTILPPPSKPHNVLIWQAGCVDGRQYYHDNLTSGDYSNCGIRLNSLIYLNHYSAN